MPLVTIEVSDSVHAFVRQRANIDGVNVEMAASNMLTALAESQRFLHAITGIGNGAPSQEPVDQGNG